MSSSSKYMSCLNIKSLLHSFSYIIYLLLLILFYQTSSLAEIRYVSKTGTSIPPYTSWETASDSIQKCINISQFGDTIYVGNGVYKEKVLMIFGLALIGGGTDSCVIDTRELPWGRSVTVKDNCIFMNFKILVLPPNQINGTGIMIGGPNVEVKHNWIEDAPLGIDCYNTTAKVSHNFIRKLSTIWLGNGITVDFNLPTIDSNYIIVNGYGIGFGLNNFPTVIGNLIVLNRSSAQGIGGGYNFGGTIKNNIICTLSESDNMIYAISGEVIMNNTIFGNFDYGIWASQEVLLRNNTVTGGKIGIRKDSGDTTLQFQYNNVWGNETNYFNYIPDSTNISADPMFVNKDSLDFHLQKYSPLIDAGDPSVLDKDSTRSDIGAFGGPFGEKYMYMDLAPRIPVNFTAVLDTTMQLFLSWDKNTETDFSHYRLYRDTIAEFIIDPTKLISEQTDTFFTEIIPSGIEKLYYKLTAVDSQANESSASQELAIIISSAQLTEPIIVSDYILYQNYPNPFNPNTMIGYRLKERGYVKLYIYDITGELVETLVNQNQEAGYYEAEFTARNITKDDLASGMYIYQIMIRNENGIPVFSDIKKMIHVK